MTLPPTVFESQATEMAIVATPLEDDFPNMRMAERRFGPVVPGYGRHAVQDPGHGHVHRLENGAGIGYRKAELCKMRADLELGPPVN
ncbi:hypothetical protein DL763_003306 [Monosporascus cannonballus]|nr:hypothetical protein DL763_003306 [Monosporascus cannonballus]